ncbi:probable serine/threonine-protein kinase yakA isoform X6 [Anopheles stephensi]|uniref:probable serine/threonine-protein kinase yakA isoform X6 n=1 Tax=Anopheles stephensi TaxID=30069 RepID=UPI001658BA9A|nr:probable serine/threonine-protein kinase yakA isoform X6 [Anopheles stephensi]XP_035893273.1 probable serine/threonine-protein kinase yakA isoform X6 [Anopheles stephensi]
MHTFSETGAGVPAFLAKLWRLVEDTETNDLISWSTDGRSFIIQNQAQFAKELLPLNYKHNNMASFIRQLNMYGFHKITSIDNGGLRFDKDEMEFTHPCFQKDHPYLLEHIKRKIATSKQQQLQAQQQMEDKSALKLEAVSRVLSEVKHMRGRQDTLDSRFQTMKQENEALWREIAILRQKHHKQQQIVNKLIQFLVTIVQPSRSGLGSMGNGSNKRRFQLMINDAPQQAKLKKSDYDDGATIEELNEALEEVAYANQQELLNSEIPEVSSPMSMPERSPYHRTATPSMSGGSSSSRSSNSSSGSGVGGGDGGGGGGVGSLNYSGGNETIEEIFSESPIPFRSAGGDAGQSGSPVTSRVGKMDTSDQDRQPKYATRSRNVGERGRGGNNVPANLIQLIESTIDGEELENRYGEPLEEENDDDEHGYLVDHVDEIDPTIVQLYNQENDNEMMLNTPMVIKEMEKQQQQQQQKQQKQRQQVGTKRGESLLKGNGADNRRNNERGQAISNAPRSQGRSLLSSVANPPSKAGGSGLKSSNPTSAPEIPSLIMTRGGKKLAMAKKQAISTNEQQQQQQQQQEDASSPGPSGFNQRDQQLNVNIANTPSPSSVASDGLSFASDNNGYIAATDIVPGDIFEDSSDHKGGGIVKNENNPSPMLSSGFNFIDGGYYNPNVNITQMKAGRQQQQQQQQVQAPQNNQQQQQQSSPSVSQMLHGEDAEYDENSLDSSLLLNRASSQAGNGDTTDQQISKFVSNDLDVSRLNTVAEYGQHIDSVQNDLESLKELLKGEGYQLDANALLGNACSTAPPFGRVYFPSCPFDLDTINKVRTDLFNNNEDMLGYDFPMNLPDMMTDDHQQQLLQQHHQQQQQQQQAQTLSQQQQQQQQHHQQQQSNNSSEKSAPSSSPTPGGHISPVPSAHTQLMTFKLNGGDPVGGNNNLPNGILGIGLHGNGGNGGMHGINGNGHINVGNGVIGSGSGTLGIVSGDYIDLNELLNMDAHCGGNDDEHSLVA